LPLSWAAVKSSRFQTTHDAGKQFNPRVIKMPSYCTTPLFLLLFQDYAKLYLNLHREASLPI